MRTHTGERPADVGVGVGVRVGVGVPVRDLR